MEFRPLDLTIISAEDLKDVQLIGKMDVYAVVSLEGIPNSTQKTPVDKDCGKKPNWKHLMRFTIDESAAQSNRLTLIFQVVADRPLAGDKVIGEIRVPVKELLDQIKVSDGENKLTYALRLQNGKTKGSIHFSYKFGDKFTSAAPTHAPPSSSDHKMADQPAMAYPAGGGYPPAGSSGGPPSGYGAPYPPPHGYPPPPHDNKHGYPGGYPPPGQGYPGGYPPPAQGYPGGYPPPAQGYPGGYPPPAQGYGYPGYPPQGQYGQPQYGQAPVKPAKGKKKHGSGMGLGLGLGAGLLGGLLVGEMVEDVAESASGFDDMDYGGGGFDF